MSHELIDCAWASGLDRENSLKIKLSQPEIEVSIAYSIWSAIRIVGTTVLGAVLFGESLSHFKIVCMLLIIFGIIGLNFAKK